MMPAPIAISTISINPVDGPGLQLDMLGKCAFAICTKGEFTIRILNQKYTVRDHCLFACMPFVNIEFVDVVRQSEIVLGFIMLEDVPRMINMWVNTDNLSAIQNHPLVEIPGPRLDLLMELIEQYLREFAQNKPGVSDDLFSKLQQDIIDLHGRLLVANVLKIYFSNISMMPSGHTHRDVVFQRFMLTLYANFRENRSVEFYAAHSGVSLKYFSTIIKKLSGRSPSQWVETVVIGEAKSMLNENDRSIKDIAADLNFPDAPTFTKYFHRVTGMNPKSYRSNRRE